MLGCLFMVLTWRSYCVDLQVPGASVSAPNISGSLPEASGDASIPSSGGMEFDVAMPSVDVGASASSASVDLPGECGSVRFSFTFSSDVECLNYKQFVKIFRDLYASDRFSLVGSERDDATRPDP